MDDSPQSLPPLFYYCYLVGFRLGQILYYHRNDDPTCANTAGQLNIVIASLCEAFNELHRIHDLGPTSLFRLVQRGGCGRHLRPLGSYSAGESRTTSLAGEIRVSLGSAWIEDDRDRARALALLDLGIEISGGWWKKDGSFDCRDPQRLEGLAREGGVVLDELILRRSNNPAFFVDGGMGTWGAIEHGLEALRSRASSNPQPSRTPASAEPGVVPPRTKDIDNPYISKSTLCIIDSNNITLTYNKIHVVIDRKFHAAMKLFACMIVKGHPAEPVEWRYLDQAFGEADSTIVAASPKPW